MASADSIGPLGPIIKSFLYIILVVGFFVGYVPTVLASIRRDLAFDAEAWRYIAWCCWVLGTFTLAWCAWYFGNAAGTSPAHFASPGRLIVRGPYRYVRNPMYLAQLVILFGHVLWTGSPMVLIYLINYWIAVYLISTHFEEPRLNEQFDGPYQQYRRRVPGWWPSLRPIGINESD
jgi:protein-S-isoprenylcysteine O-methyltransferase Ste14